jgi:hypothetical protein
MPRALFALFLLAGPLACAPHVEDKGDLSAPGTAGGHDLGGGEGDDGGAGGDRDGGDTRPSTGRDYYCDPVHGLPTNPGTQAAPWRRLEEVFAANKVFADGDIIHLLSGNHGSPVIGGGIPSGNRTILGEPGAAPVLKTLRFAAGATRWTVDGVLVSPEEADGSFIAGVLVQFDTGATNNVLRSSQLRYAPDAIAATWANASWLSNSGTAIMVMGHDNQILGNQLRNVHNGIMVERTSTAGEGGIGSIVRNNRIDHFWEDAYRGKVSDCTFEYNMAVNSYAVVPPGTESDPPHRDMFQSFRGDGSFTSIDRVVLRGNVFIARQGQRYTVVPFQYNGHYTIQGLSAFDGPYGNWTIENNVIMVEVGLAMGLYGMSNSTIANNTVVPNPLATDSLIRVTDEKAGTASPTSGKPSNNDLIINNLVHGLDINAVTNRTESNNLVLARTDYTTYFVNYAAGDLHLRAGSPAINAGTMANAPTIDADQALRVAPFDVGAYEFGAKQP